MDIVKVIWKDIVVSSGWVSNEDCLATNADLASSVGWMKYKDEEKLILVHGISNDVNNPYTVIPMGCVEQIIPLEEV